MQSRSDLFNSQGAGGSNEIPGSGEGRRLCSRSLLRWGLELSFMVSLERSRRRAGGWGAGAHQAGCTYFTGKDMGVGMASLRRPSQCAPAAVTNTIHGMVSTADIDFSQI